MIDEAQDMSEETLNVLLPTINRSGKIKVKGKELEKAPEVVWLFCMNPNLKRDPVVEKIETQASKIILHVNIFDIMNPHGPKVGQVLLEKISINWALAYQLY